jgi:hypothetical protein
MLKKRLTALILSLVLTLSFTANATEKPLPPRGTDVAGNPPFRCYTLDEYKVIAADYIDFGQTLVELDAARHEASLMRIQSAAWKTAADQTQEQVRVLHLDLQEEQAAHFDDLESARRQRWFSLARLVLSVVALGTIGTIEVVK